MLNHEGVTVLVAEDDEAVRRTLVDLLELNGYTAVAATNGDEALAAARRNPPTLILTDIAMPGLDGYGLIEQLHADAALRSVPVIILSAKADRLASRHGMELGADDYITKPFTEDEVLRSVMARLEKKALVDELDAFSHTVAHDLRNPLSTLYMHLEMLSSAIDKGDTDRMKRTVGEAIHAAARLNNIIDELLVLAGVRRQRVDSLPLDMAPIVTEATARIEQLIQRHGATIKTSATWPVAVGHGPWVVEIWVNYLSNAVKYGGPHARITLGGETRPDGRTARFWVQDEGPGLDAAAQQKMFVPFTRISSVRAGGHGLGLSIVRRIAERLDGTAGVESTPGTGARFWFELRVTAKAHSAPPFVPAIAP